MDMMEKMERKEIPEIKEQKEIKDPKDQKESAIMHPIMMKIIMMKTHMTSMILIQTIQETLHM